MKKRILSLILCALLTLSCCSLISFAQTDGEELAISDPSGIMRIVIIEKSSNIPVRIAPVKLERGGETTDAYLVCMLGVKPNNAQVNSSKNLFSAAFNRDNSYSLFVKELIKEEIPEGSSLIFACHSLGGMVAQHLRQDGELIEKYEIVNVMTAGSPLILTNKPTEGTLNRLADTGDAVPFLSPATILCPIKQVRTSYRENGGYVGNPDDAHNVSYLRSDVWGGYDALGFPGGDAVVRVNTADISDFGVVEEQQSGPKC